MFKSLLYGLVLAGGKSSRMGTDKGLIVFHGKPQREHMFDLLQSHCDKVYTSSFQGQQVPEKLNPLVDEYDLGSPINGILTAFKNFPECAWLIIAVDMPKVNHDVINLLLQNRDHSKMATCFYNSDEKLPEPLLTLWEPAAYPLLQEFVKGGRVSPRDFLKQHDIQMIYPPDNTIFQNINSQDQLIL